MSSVIDFFVIYFAMFAFDKDLKHTLDYVKEPRVVYSVPALLHCGDDVRLQLRDLGSWLLSLQARVTLHLSGHVKHRATCAGS